MPLEIEGNRFVLLYIQDITEAKRRASLEYAFLHDMNNVVFGLSGLTGLFTRVDDRKRKELAPHIQHLSNRLLAEVQLQRSLAGLESSKLPVVPRTLVVRDVLNEIEQLFSHHPSARDKTLGRRRVDAALTVETDHALLVRVLSNMLVNAFEATGPGGEVAIDVDRTDEELTFRVRNAAEIRPEHACRIFQRYFTTKPGPGRGQGTYIIKLLGEQYLGGTVGFSTSPGGTTFHLSIPVTSPETQ